MRLIVLFFSLLSVLSAAPARAQGVPCGRARPWIRVAFSGAGLPADLARSVLADLRAGLAELDIDTCESASGEPIADVVLAADRAETVAVAIDVRDGVTEKRVGRDVDLSDVPDDGRSLAIAVAAEELLQASWAELALRTAPAPSLPPPPEVTRAVTRSLPPPGPARSAVGARAAIETYGGGQTHYGADAFTRVVLGSRIAAEVAFELRGATTAAAEHGDVAGSGVGGNAGLRVGMLDPDRPLRLDATAGLRALRVTFEGRADGAAIESERTAFAVVGALGLSLGWRFDVAFVELALGGGLPIRSVDATDFGSPATGVSGWELHGAAGLGARL